MTIPFSPKSNELSPTDTTLVPTPLSEAGAP
jgi:hypothetical protein